MRVDLLSKTASVVLDASGNGTVSLRPDVGQYWAPTMVRVSTGKQTPPFPYCAVYAGPVGVTQPTQFIDDTYTGNGDSSSMISGTVQQYGDAIVVKFQGGNPGDTGIVTVYGVTADVPPAQSGVFPTVPGAHFVGRVSQAITYVSVFSKTLPANGGDTINVGFVGSSSHLGLFFLDISGQFHLTFQFYTDAGFTQPIEKHEFDTRDPGQDLLELSFPVYGPFLQITLATVGAAPQYTMRVFSMNASAQALNGFATSPPFSGPILFSQQATSIAANITTTLEGGRVWVGEASVMWFCTSGNFVGSLWAVDYLNNRHLITLSDNTQNRLQTTLFLPGMHLQFQMQNRAAASAVFDVAIYGRGPVPGW